MEFADFRGRIRNPASLLAFMVLMVRLSREQFSRQYPVLAQTCGFFSTRFSTKRPRALLQGPQTSQTYCLPKLGETEFLYLRIPKGHC